MTAFGAALVVVGVWVLIQGINGNAGRFLQGQISLGSLVSGNASSQGTTSGADSGAVAPGENLPAALGASAHPA